MQSSSQLSFAESFSKSNFNSQRPNVSMIVSKWTGVIENIPNKKKTIYIHTHTHIVFRVHEIEEHFHSIQNHSFHFNSLEHLIKIQYCRKLCVKQIPHPKRIWNNEVQMIIFILHNAQHIHMERIDAGCCICSSLSIFANQYPQLESKRFVHWCKKVSTKIHFDKLT